MDNIEKELKEDEKFLEENRSSEEPALAIGGIAGGLATLASALLFLFPNLTETQIKIILMIAVLVVPLLSALKIRSKVWSSASVNHLLWLKRQEQKKRTIFKANNT